MMFKVNNHLQNERGNIALLVMGSLVLMMVLFVFILNMGSVLATKEKSATTAKQASLAATSTLYEEVKKSISDYISTYSYGGYEDDEAVIYQYFDRFYHRVEQRKQQLVWQRPHWSENERELRAMGDVIRWRINHPLVGPVLKSVISSDTIRDATISKAQSTILANGGTLTGAEMWIENNQIHIKAANEFKATSYDQFFNGVKENIYRESAGPQVSFLYVVFPGEPTYNLDY